MHGDLRACDGAAAARGFPIERGCGAGVAKKTQVSLFCPSGLRLLQYTSATNDPPWTTYITLSSPSPWLADASCAAGPPFRGCRRRFCFVHFNFIVNYVFLQIVANERRRGRFLCVYWIRRRGSFISPPNWVRFRRHAARIRAVAGVLRIVLF